MKISLTQIARRLAEIGFAHRTSALLSGVGFVRIFRNSPLTHWIEVDWAGRRGEAVFARASAAVSKCVVTRGLFVDQLIFEVAKDKERGWTLIEDAKSARDWEKQLIVVAPPIVESFAAEHGPPLLQRTAATRAAVARYLEKLRALDPAEDRLHSLKRLAGPDALAEAERLAGWPGVLHLRGAQDHYLLACLLITVFENQVETDGSSFAGLNPLHALELQWRIQLIADELLYQTRTIQDDMSSVEES